MRIVALPCLATALLLAGCNQAPNPSPSETRGLPQVQNPYVPGAGGVTPLERPAGSRGGDKGS